MDPLRQLSVNKNGRFAMRLFLENQNLTARSRGTNRRCPIPRSSNTRQAYSFTSLLLSSCISWDFLMGGASLGAGVGQGTPSSISKKQQVSRVRSTVPLSHNFTRLLLSEPALGLWKTNTFTVYTRDFQVQAQKTENIFAEKHRRSWQFKKDKNLKRWI